MLAGRQAGGRAIMLGGWGNAVADFQETLNYMPSFIGEKAHDIVENAMQHPAGLLQLLWWLWKGQVRIPSLKYLLPQQCHPDPQAALLSKSLFTIQSPVQSLTACCVTPATSASAEALQENGAAHHSAGHAKQLPAGRP